MGLYYEPSGHMVEPDSNKKSPMGTREVDAYTVTPHEYSKILFIEKRGLEIGLADANIGQLFDMSIIYSVGYSSVAARNLLARLQKGAKYDIYVLHDADIHRYNIARTLSEATYRPYRLPDHSIEVHDLGLTIKQGCDAGLESEAFERTYALPARIVPDLTPQELEWFTGERIADKNGKPQWGSANRAERLRYPELIDFIKARLTFYKADTKVGPP
jgi:hypothetical protein